jgi:hypothetical protein
VIHTGIGPGPLPLTGAEDSLLDAAGQPKFLHKE